MCDILYAGKVMDPERKMSDLLEEIEEYYEPLVLYVKYKPENEQYRIDEKERKKIFQK